MSAIDGRTVAWGLGLQVLFALLVLKTTIGQQVFKSLAAVINKLLDFAFAKIRRLVRRDALLSEAANDFRPRGFYKPGQFVQIVPSGFAFGQLNADQNGRLA